MEPLPIVCTLSEEALNTRQANMLDQLFGAAQAFQQLESGYKFRFDASDQILLGITEMIIKERKCCRFLSFNLEVPSAEGPVWLSVEGPTGTKDFLESIIDISLINEWGL